MQIDKSMPVMVTGATGYVAGWLVKRLLDEGLTVHAPVRNPDDKDKLKYLDAVAAQAPGKIVYFKADLLDMGSYAQAMAGCQVVFHTASPFSLSVKNPQKDLVEPALLGTRNVLETVDKVPSVKRVVLTSSTAAIFGDNADLPTTPKGIFTEEVWNTSSSLTQNPYSYSKTVAEQEAWKINKAQSRWDLVTINPTVVIGPGINPHGTSESFNIVRQIGSGAMKPGAPDLPMGVVDVREVAEAHLRAAFTPAARGRYILSGYDTSLLEMAKTLQPKFSHYPLPTRTLPKFLVWLFGPITTEGITRTFVTRNVGLPFKADNSRSRNELGIKYRPLAESMNEFFQQMVDSGRLRKR